MTFYSRAAPTDKVPDTFSIFSLTKSKVRIGKNRDATAEDVSIEEPPLQFYNSPIILMDKLSRIIYSTIDEKVTGSRSLTRYSPKKFAILCQALATEIKRRVKQLEMRSYRIVTMLSIVPKQQQGVSYKMALHGDHLVDFFGNNKYQQETFFILGTVYMVYKH